MSVTSDCVLDRRRCTSGDHVRSIDRRVRLGLGAAIAVGVVCLHLQLFLIFGHRLLWLYGWF